ncbi:MULTISPECIES: ATP-binding protein [unclassified Exiguobacterium]|uniref:ATP-binding protein n=1 Tax=unclassified Exiguobacterium TaxID=2644629 RepID=UPI001BE51CE7|nr:MULTISPECIES: ATP-binding protein [unclassified Exiguobacterium]
MREVQVLEPSSLQLKVRSFEDQMGFALEMVDDVVLKQYITKLEDMDVIPLDPQQVDRNIAKNVRMFKINEIVYAKDEDATYKLAGVFSAVSVHDCSVFVLIDSDGTTVDFYMGIRSLDESNSTKTTFDTLRNAMNGHFPGIQTENLNRDRIESLLVENNHRSVSIVTGVADYKAEAHQSNASFIQGLEKLALTMQGEAFTGVILANPTSRAQLLAMRKEYENIYSSLAPFASTQLSYGINDSLNQTQTFTQGTSQARTYTTNESNTETKGSSESTNQSVAISRNTLGSLAGKGAGTALTVAGGVIGSVVPVVGTAAGMLVGGAIGAAVGAATHATKSTTTGSSTTQNQSTSRTSGSSNSTSDTTNESSSDAKGITRGNSETIQLTHHNKTLQNYLQRIDRQLERLEECENLGMWECSAYFMSENTYASDVAAATYKALMQGEKTGLEIAALNSWSERDSQTGYIQDYIRQFMHPVFRYVKEEIQIPIYPTSLVSGRELAIHMGLPRRSVSGFPVMEHVDFAPEVVTREPESNRFINLGAIYHYGQSRPNRVKLNLESLSMHTLITGSTGSGKSNTIYELLSQIEMQGIRFMVIEPAKGEYKHVFGHASNVHVFGTNPRKSNLLRINPFRFPEDVHVLEHIDRLVDIFNVCWPMYAAMPALLKEAMLHTYEACGWDLMTSVSAQKTAYPTFLDLQESLTTVIEQTAYDQETKGNYVGSLLTRVKSLTNGINGQIFCDGELDNELLFDANVIVDLSRVGSAETKSFIMGILVMRLNEHRMTHATTLNSPLRHVTVLEEAHHLLKRTSTEQSAEGSNLAGKSVEMLSNAIAEMRTYGEGFIIVDQSPNMLDLSAIRNTNTKIILRLPDESDRQLVGKAAGLTEEQLNEVIRLPKGVAAIYQNEWLSPVLCHVNRFEGVERPYEFKGIFTQPIDLRAARTTLIEYVLRDRVRIQADHERAKLLTSLEMMPLSIATKQMTKERIHSNDRDLSFYETSELVYRLIDAKKINSLITSPVKQLEDMHRQLQTFVAEQTTGLSKEYVLATIQSVLRHHLAIDVNRINVYESWVEGVQKGVIR